MCPFSPQPKHVYLLVLKSFDFLPLYLLEDWCLLPFFLENLINFFDIRLNVSSPLSLDSWHLLCLVVFKAMPLACLSSFSWRNNMFISNSCSLSFPNNEVVVIEVRSLDSYMAVTFGYHVLSRHLRIFIFSSSFSKFFPRLIRWFTIWENIFCTLDIVSPFCILNISYSWMRACFLAIFTSFVPSCVTSRMSHISFADAHYDTLKNSSQLNVDVIIFFKTQSNLAFLLSNLVYSDQGFSTHSSSFFLYLEWKDHFL